MKGQRILLVDDDPDLVRVLGQALSKEGAQVYAASDGREGLCQFHTLQPDLVILDTVMPVMDGWQTLSRIREQSDVPVILLTAEGQQPEAPLGLSAGATDQVAKPPSIPDLVVRARAVLGPPRPRRDESKTAWYDDGHLRVDLEAQQVHLDEQLVPLTELEFKTLVCLVQYRDRVLTLEQILRWAWGPAYCDAPHYVRTYIRRLRLKLEAEPADPQYLLTVRGAGYRFRPQERFRKSR